MHFVYVLVKDNKVVYVGQSTNLKRRVTTHKRDKDFDFMDILEECEDKKTAERLEDKYIAYYNPLYNKKLNSKGKYTTIKEFCEEFEIEDCYNFIHSLLCNKITPLFADKYSYTDLYYSYTQSENICFLLKDEVIYDSYK